jgi:hypothetical protein
MTVVRRGLFIILGAATAASLGAWTPSARAQTGKKSNTVSSTSKGHKGTGTSGTGTTTGTGSTGTTTGTSGTGTSTGISGISTLLQYFPPTAVWTQDVSSAPVDPQSATMINTMSQAGGWGTGIMRVDEGIRVMQANASTPTVPFSPGPGFYSVDSDLVSSVPLPPGGGMEGQSGYQCDITQNDCHFIVVNNDQGKLYEAWGANYNGSALSATILAIWDLTQVYPASGRGDQCSSADAAGYPIAPLLFTADELKQGHIDHAIRFILPNNEIRAGVFVHPATHAGAPSGPATALPYGAHLRLKASYDVTQLKPAARVVAAAMQKYGMFLADGGNIALTAQSDQDTQTKYTDVDFTTTDLSSLKPTDFEVVQMPATIPLTYDCVRNNIP